MKDFIATRMGLPLTVDSDDLGCFTVVASMGDVQAREVIGGGYASVLDEKLHALNTLIGNCQSACHSVCAETFSAGPTDWMGTRRRNGAGVTAVARFATNATELGRG